MSYTIDALDPTRPTLSDDAGQLSAELRAIKAHLVADKDLLDGLASAFAAEVAARTALDAAVNTRISDTMAGAAGKPRLMQEALGGSLANFILGEQALRRRFTCWPHPPRTVPTNATNAKNTYASFKAISLASDREGRGAWRRPLTRTPTDTFGSVDPIAVIDNSYGIDLVYSVVVFYRAWSDQRIDVRLLDGGTVLETINDIAVNPPGDTAILRSVTFSDITVPTGTSVELSLEGYIWAGGGDDIAYLEDVIIKPAVI